MSDTTEIGGQFMTALRNLCLDQPIRKVLETGTYKGTGSTMTIAKALRESGRSGWKIDTVEINPVFAEEAAKNLAEFGMSVAVHQGLSLHSSSLPGLKQIDVFVRAQAEKFPDIYIDHPLKDACFMYHKETAWPFASENLIAELMGKGAGPDLILLDSAGHLGLMEFEYVTQRLKKPTWLALDDIKHLKHRQSTDSADADPRFDLFFRTYEKFGSCIYKFTPHTKQP